MKCLIESASVHAGIRMMGVVKMSIKLKDMRVGIPYVVVKGGQSLDVGDRVVMDKSRCIICQSAGGWLVPEDWKRLKNRVEVDVGFINRKILKLQEEIKHWSSLIMDECS